MERDSHNHSTALALEPMVEASARFAHDVRSPLSAVALLLDRIPDGAEGTCLLRRTVERLSALTEQYLNELRFAREGQRASEAVSKQSLRHLVSEIIEEKRVTAGSKWIELEEPSDLRRVLIKRESFRSALSNIIQNALDASPEGGRIAITISQSAKATSVDVRDWGKGLPENAELGSFGGTYEKDGGHGIGLYQAQVALEEMGGSIRWKAAEPGMIFRLRVPNR